MFENEDNNNLINSTYEHISKITPKIKIDTKRKKIFDPFDTPESDDDVDEEHVSISSIICVDCNIKMIIKSSEMVYECQQCGRLEDNVGNDIDITTESNSSEVVNNYNTSDSSAAPIRISGPNNYIYQKKLVSSTSNYKKTQKKNTNDQIINAVYQYKGSTPPKNIVLEAADLYCSVQQHCIKRGDVRKGTMAACLYMVCINNNITRKPKEISDIFDIPQSELSNGEKILDDLIASGLITPKSDNQIVSSDPKSSQIMAFLDRYFECINIQSNYYKTFAFNLVTFTRKYRIAESSVVSSKCAGAIYVLSLRKKELDIKKETIEQECCISKSTFSRYAHCVFDMLNSTDEKNKKVRSRLRNLFKKYQVSIT